jgi:hypothetical protein
MRTGILPAVVLFFAVSIAGCLSEATRKELSDAGANVAMLTLKVQKAEASNAADLSDLRLQLNDAKIKLIEVEAKATAEREKPIGDVAAGVETATSAAQPIVAVVFPAALPILGLIGGIATLLRKKFKPEVK